jgi:putative zinc finger/helix-turn-helix YgiT family protein
MTHEQTSERGRKRGDRPFPWCCPNCLKEEVYPKVIPYSTDVPHDGRQYPVEVPQLRIPKCRACGNLLFTNSVDEQIGRALRTQARLLQPEQIRSGREALGLKGNEFAERLGVAAETISRWERGGMIQSRAMDNFLRVYFAVPEVRTLLRGAEQDVNLGAAVVPDSVARRCPKNPTPREIPEADRQTAGQGTSETTMNFAEIHRRLSLIAVIHTPTGLYQNEIQSVGADSVTVRSNKPGSHSREIPYRDILHGNTTNGRIIVSFRQVLGLTVNETMPENGDEE